MKDFEDKQDYFSEADLNENDSENEENLKINKEKTQSIKKVVRKPQPKLDPSR
jgi:hypothetical protein